MATASTSALNGTWYTLPPESAELREVLGNVLGKNHVFGLPITSLERCASPYRSCFPLEEIHVSLSDGGALDIIFKDLSRSSLPKTVRQAKPDFLYDPLREIETYRKLLAPSRLGTAHCYGAVVDERLDRYWLFLEKVPGEELYKIGEFSRWEAAARWLARMHGQLAAQLTRRASRSRHWLHCNAEYFRLWMRRAQDLSDSSCTPRSLAVQRRINQLARHYDQVIERLVAQAITVIHGEFYASNILVGHSSTGLRICPVDWEMAAVGPGLLDLAALVSGHWTDAERTTLALAYYHSLPKECGIAPVHEDAFLKALDDCRLQIAVQWLGWSNHWTPPAEHAQDWLGEALHLAEKVNCL